jgi:uncharacterized protein YkwD
VHLRRTLPATAAVVALLALLVAEGAVGVPNASLVASAKVCPGSRSFNVTPSEQRTALLCLINFARSTAGLAFVQESGTLSRVARAKGRDIVLCRDFDHGACGKPVFAKLDASGYRYRLVGENLYAAERPTGTARDAFVAWLNSPPHRQVIFLPRFSDAGIALFPLATFQGTRNVQLWVLKLARRA